MIAVNPYLNFPGTTEEAFNFYKSVFGGEFINVQRFKDTPEADKIPAGEADKLMHIALPVGPNTILMGTDALESMGQKLSFGNNMHLTLGVSTKEEADRLFAGLSAGGKITVPMSDMFWGAYFGMFTDKYGVQWMISYDPNHLPENHKN
jgi:PhnB protein